MILSISILVAAVASVLGAPAVQATDITAVSLDRTSINWAEKEAGVNLSYTLLKDDKVTIKIFDPDNGLVRTLIDNAARKSGQHRETWDGRDFEGMQVPDEAYTFTIETNLGSTYDPTAISGGFVSDVSKAKFNKDGTVVYKLPRAAQVLIRLGIKGGPMLGTLVDWEPRVAGSITENWDWKDEDDLIDLKNEKKFTALITYVDLPDATVITYGNKKETYREYKLGRGKDRPLKPDRGSPPNPEKRLRASNILPNLWSRSPDVELAFPKAKADDKGVFEVSESAIVRVDVAKEDKAALLADQFEIIFYVDNVFFAEAERGHVPFNWKWELNQIPEGEHILTVNISSFRGQVGVASKKVRVVKEGKKK